MAEYSTGGEGQSPEINPDDRQMMAEIKKFSETTELRRGDLVMAIDWLERQRSVRFWKKQPTLTMLYMKANNTLRGIDFHGKSSINLKNFRALCASKILRELIDDKCPGTTTLTEIIKDLAGRLKEIEEVLRAEQKPNDGEN